MAMTVSQLMVNIGGDAKGAQAAISSTAAMMGKTGMLGLAAVAAGAAVAGVGIIATKMAGDFQAGMESIVTGAGEAQSNVGLISKGVLQLAKDTGTSTDQLTAGLYMIESGGYHGAAGLNILKAAAQGAKVGNADLGVVADATDTILKNFGASGLTASEAVNTLVATVAHGKTHMQDLSSSLAQVLPTAASAGIGLNDVMGAMATMTAEGVPAAEAATYLRQTMIALSAPAAGARHEMESLGLSASGVAAEMQKSLPGAMAMITDAISKKFPQGTPGYLAAMREIMGGMRQMQGGLDLGGAHIGMFKDNVDIISKAVKNGGQNIAGWDVTQKTFNLQLARAGEVAQTLMIELGQKLLPVATQLFSWIADNAIPTIKNFVSWITGSSQSAQILRPVLVVLAVAIAGALVASFVAWAWAAGAAAVATIAATWPILAIGAAIALLAAGIIYAYTHWGWFRKIVDLVGLTIKDFAGLLGQLKDQALKGLTDFMKGPGGLALLGFKMGFVELKDIIGKIMGSIGDLLGALGHLKDAAGNTLGLAGKGAHALHIPGFAAGTDDAPGGLAYVHQDELVYLPQHSQVTPLSKLGRSSLSALPAGSAVASHGAGSASGSGTQSNTFIIELDGRVLAKSTLKHAPGVVRLATGTRGF